MFVFCGVSDLEAVFVAEKVIFKQVGVSFEIKILAVDFGRSVAGLSA